MDEIKPQVDHHTMKSGRKIIVLAKGRLVNLMALTMRTGIISCRVKSLLHRMKYGMMGIQVRVL